MTDVELVIIGAFVLCAFAIFVIIDGIIIKNKKSKKEKTTKSDALVGEIEIEASKASNRQEQEKQSGASKIIAIVVALAVIALTCIATYSLGSSFLK